MPLGSFNRVIVQMPDPVSTPISLFARRTTRLSDAFLTKSPFPIGTLAPLACNIRAIEAAADFARAIKPFVAIVGPSGWGKTHLLDSTALAVGVYQGQAARVVDARTWALESLDPIDPRPLILDDVQDVLGQPRARHCLTYGLERRARLNRPTMLGYSAASLHRDLHQLLPSGRPWVLAMIREPDVDDRETVVRQLAKKEGVRLSRLACRLVARMVSGNAYSISGALRRAKLEREDWSAPEEACALCGILLPHLSDADWDPRDVVAEVTAGVLEKSGGYAKLTREISAYMLCREVGLSESDVADYLLLPPGEVYGWVRLVDSQNHDEHLQKTLRACKNALLQSFSSL